MGKNPFRGSADETLTPAILKGRIAFYSNWIKELPEDIQILDIAEPNPISQSLQEKYRLNIVNTEGDLNFADWTPIEQFQCVFCFEVIEHLQNPLFFLKELRKRMVPEGQLFLTCPKATFRLLQMPDHFNEMDEYRLRTVFDIARDFEIVEFGETGSNYPWFIFWRGYRPLLRALFQKSFYLKAIAK
ncbi:hypothetical protein CEE37_08330 [candidate division LCP-89 bacterium B3_LCP]|uniref:Methyltransferase type 11 n=1 Tax=candidate division LCP-89 bacterium B3_LCP TaxID=2012998 RepID=A0A532UZD5_UNCL8|nr:MAG: hypothetical protein CEE37_08330 [candidate division LCP-89 bacterium B3_LCP]